MINRHKYQALAKISQLLPGRIEIKRNLELPEFKVVRSIDYPIEGVKIGWLKIRAVSERNACIKAMVSDFIVLSAALGEERATEIIDLTTYECGEVVYLNKINLNKINLK